MKRRGWITGEVMSESALQSGSLESSARNTDNNTERKQRSTWNTKARKHRETEGTNKGNVWSIQLKYFSQNYKRQIYSCSKKWHGITKFTSITGQGTITVSIHYCVNCVPIHVQDVEIPPRISKNLELVGFFLLGTWMSELNGSGSSITRSISVWMNI